MANAPVPISMETEREFPFSLKEFRHLAAFMHERTGIVLGEHKMNMVYARLARRLRELRFSSFADYQAYYWSPDGAHEVEFLINALTTNLTRFFREEHHFNHLSQHVLQPFAESPAKDRRLRIWSAGCSTGEEPYSIAMTLAETLGDRPAGDVRVLATDLDSSVVAKGRAGHYSSQGVSEIAKARLMRHFDRDGSGWRAKRHLGDLITFKQLNLLESWPMRGPFDAIFCRNVMIYFDNPTKARLVSRLAELLVPGGWLYIGHSETLLDKNGGLTLKAPTTYQKGYAR